VGNKITVLWDVMPSRSVEKLHESKQSLSLSAVLLSYLKAIWECTVYSVQCSLYSVHFEQNFVFAIIIVKVLFILNLCICQESAIRRK
jgi:hypothetical protein